MKVNSGRYTAALDPKEHAGLVLFHIGMRFNQLRRPKAYLPVFGAMPKMLKELAQHPELGLLHTQTFWSGRTILMVQYWRDFAALDAFARSPEQPHLPAWRAYNKAIRSSDAVGVYHETFVIGGGKSEAIYVDMPVFGLAAATSHVPITAKDNRAMHRIDPTTADSVLVES